MRSSRSAATPPIKPISTEGKRSAKATAPSQEAEWVSSQVNQPIATRCTHIPISEMPLPAVYRP
ncbi:MAG: hypothetical protein ACMVO3_06170 [Thalassobaculum sp.]